MWQSELDTAQPGEAWSGEGAARQDAHVEPAVPYEKTPQAILWRMGLVLAGALGFALAVNLALVAFHIG